MNFMNEELHWFLGKRTLIDGGVYMRFNAGVGSKFAPFFPTLFCILVLVCSWFGWFG